MVTLTPSQESCRKTIAVLSVSNVLTVFLFSLFDTLMHLYARVALGQPRRHRRLLSGKMAVLFRTSDALSTDGLSDSKDRL